MYSYDLCKDYIIRISFLPYFFIKKILGNLCQIGKGMGSRALLRKSVYSIFPVWYNNLIQSHILNRRKAGEVMTEKELLQRNIEEFSRVQDWMLLSEKNSNSYKAMRKRYIELKIILMASGVNLNELDMIKE